MSPQDKRHGTTAGYCAGCREFCCRRAAAVYERQRNNRRYIRRGPLHTPGLGTRRRLQALTALGWSGHALEAQLGQRRSYVSRLVTADGPVLEATAQKIASLYDRLSMTLPPERTRGEKSAAVKARRYAQRMGWAPPLAWDDIDTDPEPQWGGADTDVDPVVVMRLLEGESIKTATRAEKDAAVGRWVADGGSKAEICRWHGWNDSRDVTPLRLIRGGAA